MRTFESADRPPMPFADAREMNPFSESNTVDKNMHERSTERRPKPVARISVKEAMMKRDADVDIATSALRAATDDVTACIAELMHFIAPRGVPVPSRGGFPDRGGLCRPLGLADEIHDVTHQLRALQRAAELATRRARRRAAEGSAPQEQPGS